MLYAKLTEINNTKELNNTIYLTIILYEYLVGSSANAGKDFDSEISNRLDIPSKIIRDLRYFRNDLVHLNKNFFRITNELSIDIHLNNYKIKLEKSIERLEKYLKNNNLKDIEI